MFLLFFNIETNYLGTMDFVTRVFIAFLLGAAIGTERQWREKSAGLRTNALVSIGSAAYILLSVYIFGENGGDPGRIAAQIVTGIGFLGAGVIMKDGMTIHGLNTAATIWCSAAVGSLCGLGMYAEALIVTIAIISTHLIMRSLGEWLGVLKSYKKRKSEEAFYLLKVVCEREDELEVRSFLMDYLDESDKYLIRSIFREVLNEAGKEVVLNVKISTVGKKEELLESLIGQLVKEKDIEEASWFYLGNSIEN